VHVRYALALLAILGACVGKARTLEVWRAKNDGLSEWGPEQEGVRTSLIALRERTLSRETDTSSLEMENVGSRVIHYDPTQVAINSSMYIEGNDGVEVPSIAPGAQTEGTRAL
jgi:hypothetical protein